MNENKKANIMIVLLAAVILALIIQGVFTSGRLDALASQVSTLQGDLNIATQQLYGQLTSYVDTTLRQSQSLVESYTVSYSGVDTAAKTVKVHLQFRLKDVLNGTTIKVYAVPANPAAMPGDGFEAVTGNGVDYTGDFALPYTDDYNLDIYQTDAAGSSKKLNAESVPVNIKSEFDNRTAMPTSGTGRTPENVDVSFALENRTFGQKDFQIRKVELILTADGQEAARRDVTQRSIANAADIDRYNLMAAAGDPNIAASLPPNPEVGKMQTDPGGVERGYFVESFPYGQSDGETEKQYGFYVEVTYENGEVFELGQR